MELVCRRLHGQLVLRVGARSGAPSLAVDIDRRIDLVDGGSYGVHRLDVVHAHEVEAEAIDVELVDPVFHALYHKLAHQRTLRGRLVAAARPVGVASVGRLAVVIVGIGALEIASVDVERVVVHGVEDDAYACLVERLHHGLHLAYAHRRLVGVGGVATLRHIVVLRVVAPVELRPLQLHLVDRGIVEQRLEMDGVHAQPLQVVDGAGLCECQVLSLVLQPRRGADGEVAHVQFVDHEVGGRGQRGSSVVAPSLGVGVGHVEYGASVAVHAHRLGERSRTFAKAHVEGVEPSCQVALEDGLPAVVSQGPHLHRLDGFASLRVLVDAHLRHGGCVEVEHGLRLAIFHLVKSPLGVGVPCHHGGKDYGQ